jgi:hypothetical protein
MPQKEKSWWGNLESNIKQVLRFQETQKKLMYHQHVKEKEAICRQKMMMHHLGMPDVKSRSEDNITPKEKWVEHNFKSFQWTDRDQFVSVDDLDASTSHAMESPPDARSADEEYSEEEHEW